MAKVVRALLVAALFALPISLPAAEAESDISKARKLLRSKDPADRADAIRLLVRADSRSAIRPLEDAIRRTRKDMEEVAERVDELDVLYMDAANSYSWAKARGYTDLLNAALRAKQAAAAAWRNEAAIMRGHLGVIIQAGAGMTRFQSPGAVNQIDKGAQNERDALIRQMYVQALGATARVESIPTLVGLLENGDARVRSMAAQSLRPFVLRKRVLRALKNHAEDKSWSVRLSIYETMARAPFEEAVPFLVQAMAREQGQMAVNVDALLTSLTGRSFHGDPRGWASWWATNGKAIKDGSYEPPAETKREGEHTVSTFFSIPIVSKNVTFVLDLSASMKDPFKVSDGHMRRTLEEAGLPETRLGYALAEISKALKELPKDARFNVIAYGDEAVHFAKKTQKATPGTKKRAVKWLRKRDTQWLTNIWGALRASFSDHLEAPSGRRLFTELPDTVVFLTDGIPTRGRFQHTEAIETLVGLWNQAAGTVIHTVGIGEDHEKELLLALARKTNGFYVDLSKGQVSLEKHPRTVPKAERRPHFARAIKQLLTKLQEGDWEDRLAAVKALRKLGPWAAPAAKHLGDALADDDSDVGDAAVRTLISMGLHAIEPARAKLEHEDYEVVIRALRVLRGLGGEAVGALEDIARALDHEDNEVKVAAIGVLAAMGKAAAPALERLKACSANEDEDVQKATKRAITSIEGG